LLHLTLGSTETGRLWRCQNRLDGRAERLCPIQKTSNGPALIHAGEDFHVCQRFEGRSSRVGGSSCSKLVVTRRRSAGRLLPRGPSGRLAVWSGNGLGRKLSDTSKPGKETMTQRCSMTRSRQRRYRGPACEDRDGGVPSSLRSVTGPWRRMTDRPGTWMAGRISVEGDRSKAPIQKFCA
jgi:hypothetical protein